MKITKRQLRKIIREAVGDSVKIAGTTVFLSDMKPAKKTASRASGRGPYGDTHGVITPPEGTSTPEEAVEYFNDLKRIIPGTLTIYQDRDTGRIFAYAVYNTF